MRIYPKAITILYSTFHRFTNPRAQLAALSLVAVLQKAPAVVRSFNAMKYSIEPGTRILQRIAVTAASLGTVHAVSGATSFTVATTEPQVTQFTGLDPVTININVGESLKFGAGVTLDNSQHLADSWQLMETIPPGLTIQGDGNTTPNAQGIFNTFTVTMTGMPTTAGSFTFTLKPFNGPNGTKDSIDPISITINVLSVNSAPTLTSDISNRIGEENQAFSLNISSNFTDTDAGDTLTYSASLDNNADLPNWLLFDTATGTFSGTPANGDSATLAVTVTASDSEASISDTFTIEVLEERILQMAIVEVMRLGADFKISWPTELAHNYQLETSSDANLWTIDNRGVTEAFGFQSVTFTIDEVSQNLFIRVESTLESLQ